MLGWARLALELGRWRWAGKRPRLWWRDDDARRPTWQLKRLIAQSTRAGTPLFLSVVPDGLDPMLCELIAPYRSIVVLQHGCRHLNEAGLPASEFSPELPPEKVEARLMAGWQALGGFRRRLPVYVPPWNCLTPNVEAALAKVGYAAVSAWRDPSSRNRVDVHVDLLRWRPEPRFAGQERVLRHLRKELQRRRRQGRWEEPIGLLTHHLDHDEDTWRFMDRLLLFQPLEAGVDWPDAPALFGCDYAALTGAVMISVESSAA